MPTKTKRVGHLHVENLDYSRTVSDYNANYGPRKVLEPGSFTRNDSAPKWLRKNITVTINEHGFYEANGSLIRRSIILRYYTRDGEPLLASE